MNLTKWAVLIVLVDFVAFTAWVVATGGNVGEIIAAFSSNPWQLQVAIDLVLALSLVCVWMWNDARQRGANPLPWVVATAFTGSIAPLAYLLLRPSAAGETTVQARTANVSAGS